MNNLERLGAYTQFLNQFYTEKDLDLGDQSTILAAIRSLESGGNRVSGEQLELIDREIVRYSSEKNGGELPSTDKVAHYIQTTSPLAKATAHLAPQFATDYVKKSLAMGEKIVFVKDLLETLDFSAFTEAEKLKIAKQCALSDIELFCEHMDKFPLNDANKRVDFILDLVDEKEHLFQYLHHFKITNLEDVLKIIAKANDYDFYKPKSIRKDMLRDLYEFTQKNNINFLNLIDQLFKIDKELIHQIELFVPKEDHDLLIETFKIATKYITQYDNFFEELKINGITESDDLFKILSELGNNKPDLLTYYIEEEGEEIKFNEVFDKDAKHKLFAKCLFNAETMKRETLELFDVEIESCCELFEQVSKTNGRVLLELLPQLDLTNEQKLEFAHNIIENSPLTVAKLMPFFNFPEESIRFELAKKCAKLDLIAPFVDLFQLTSEHAKEIWFLSYQRTPYESVENLEKFGITDFDFLSHVIMKCVKEGDLIGNQINLLPNSWQEQRLKIALEYAKHNPLRLAANIDLFDIESADERFKLALLCAKSGNPEFGGYVKNFKIADPDQLRQIVECYVLQWAINQGEEIPKRDALNFYNLGCSKDDLKDLMILVFRKNPCAALWFANHINDNEIKNELGEIKEFFYGGNFNSYALTNSKNFIEKLKESGFPVSALEKLYLALENVPNPQVGQILYNQLSQKMKLAYQMKALARWVLDEKQYKSLLEAGIFEKMLAYNQPGSAWALFGAVLDQFRMDQNEEFQKIDELIAKKKSVATGKEFIAILCKSLVGKGVEASTVMKLVELIFNATQNFKDGKKAADLIDLLIELTSNDDLDNKTKERIIDKICVDVNASMRRAYDEFIKGRKLRPEQIEKGFNDYLAKTKSESYVHEIAKQFLTLLRFGKPELLDEFLAGARYENILEAEFQNSILSTPVDGFFEKFEHSFGKFRNPVAIFQFAGSIATLNDPKAAESLSEFAETVLENRFRERRYDIEGNVHLKKIHEAHPEVLERWKSNLKSVPFSEATENQAKTAKKNDYIVVETDAPDDLLLSGTEITGSCQHVLKYPDKNKGLLGYLMNGTNKMVKVSKGEEGAIEARCMIRLLWDGERPVIFKEYIYPSPCNFEMSQALDRMVEQKARELGVPIIETPLEKDYRLQVYPKKIHSLGGRAPYDYCDANHEVASDGKYTIPSAFVMYDPNRDPNNSVKVA